MDPPQKLSVYFKRYKGSITQRQQNKYCEYLEYLNKKEEKSPSELEFLEDFSENFRSLNWAPGDQTPPSVPGSPRPDSPVQESPLPGTSTPEGEETITFTEDTQFEDPSVGEEEELIPSSALIEARTTPEQKEETEDRPFASISNPDRKTNQADIAGLDKVSPDQRETTNSDTSLKADGKQFDPDKV